MTTTFLDYAANLAVANPADTKEKATATTGIGSNAEQGNNYAHDLNTSTALGASTGGLSGSVKQASSLSGATATTADQSYYDALKAKASAKAGNINLGSGYGGSTMDGAKAGMAGAGSTAQQDAFAGTGGAGTGQAILEEDYNIIMDKANEAMLDAAADKAASKDTDGGTPYTTGGMDDSLTTQGDISFTDPITQYTGGHLEDPMTYQERQRGQYTDEGTQAELEKWRDIDAQQYAEGISEREAGILDEVYKRMMGEQMRGMQSAMGARGMGMGGAASAMAGDIAASAALDRAREGIGIRQGARGEALGMKQGALGQFGQRDRDIFGGQHTDRSLTMQEEARKDYKDFMEGILEGAFDIEPVGAGGDELAKNEEGEGPLEDGGGVLQPVVDTASLFGDEALDFYFGGGYMNEEEEEEARRRLASNPLNINKNWGK